MPHRHTLLAASLLLTACSDATPSGQHTPDQPADLATPAEDLLDAPDLPPTLDPDHPPAFAQRSRQGRWYAGDLHVHATGASNDASDASTPERIREVAISYGLDFVVLTDHSNSTGSDTTTRDEDPSLFNRGPEFPYWDTAQRLSDSRFLMVDGNEISPVTPNEDAPTGHIGCSPMQLATFDHPNIAFIDRPRGTVTGGQVLQQALDVGCFTVLNHPFGPTSWVAYDWTSRDYHAMEIWNGGAGYDVTDRQATDAWLCDLSLGKRTAAVGGSDNHKIEQPHPGTLLDPVISSPTTWAFAPSLTWDAIRPALQDAHVSISDTGAPLELDLHAPDGAWLAMSGDALPASRAPQAWLRVQGSLPKTLPNTYPATSRRLDILHVAPNACEDLRAPNSRTPPNPNATTVFTTTLEPNDAPFSLAIPIELTPGAYVAILVPARTGITPSGGAIANAILITL